ncbi:hypothetical protein [uncultured Mucilaginibacter sp.]|uniref:hypothetical protein n=1 Tax=uncultured Mucilaginibacter sp. TaxID=797541 RepID=UPI0025E6BF53|nr:hypothetical protein [uncultured Mucilaginibacter sp.]
MLKVNLKTNQLIFTATIVYIVLSIAEFYLKISQVAASNTIYYAYSIFMEALYVLLIFYLISILMFFGEKTEISTAVTMLICIDILRFIATEWPGKVLSYGLTPTLGILTLVAYIYLVVQFFKVKSSCISRPFRLLGLSFFAVMLIKSAITIAFPLIADGINQEFNNIFSLLIPLSILYILKKATRLIKDKNIELTA